MLNRIFKSLWLFVFGWSHIDKGALEEGRLAYDLGRTRNPYPRHTYKYASWQRGYDESLAQDPHNAW